MLGKKEGANFTLFQDDEGYRATLDVPVEQSSIFPGALAFEISRFRGAAALWSRCEHAGVLINGADCYRAA